MFILKSLSLSNTCILCLHWISFGKLEFMTNKIVFHLHLSRFLFFNKLQDQVMKYKSTCIFIHFTQKPHLVLETILETQFCSLAKKSFNIQYDINAFPWGSTSLLNDDRSNGQCWSKYGTWRKWNNWLYKVLLIIVVWKAH